MSTTTQKNKKEPLLNKAAFEEYYQKEQQKNILLHKIVLFVIAVINVLFLIFIFTYKYQISILESNIDYISKQLETLDSNYDIMLNSSQKKMVNLFGNILVNLSLIIFLFKSKEELQSVLKWANIEETPFDLCFKGTYYEFKYSALKDCLYGDTFLIVLITEQGHRFGAFVTGVNSENEESYFESENAFLFNLDNLKKFDIKNKEYAFKFDKESFFTFGNGDLVIGPKPNESNQCYSNFPKDYGSSNNEVKDLTGEKENFVLMEIEILCFLKF